MPGPAGRLTPHAENPLVGDEGGNYGEQMQLFDRVAIIVDQHFTEHATALRAFLESMRLRVDVYRIVQDRNVHDFFEHQAHRYSHTVIQCHGTGEDDQPSIDLTAVRPFAGDDYSTDGEWEPVTVALTPTSVGTIIAGRGHGTLVSLACGSGRPALGTRIIAQGYDTYIAPSTPYVDIDAALVFAMNYFYALLSADRDHSPAYSPEEAFALARGVDADFTYGPGVMRWYAQEQ